MNSEESKNPQVSAFIAGMAQVDTIPGSEPGSYYLVIAQNDVIKIGVRPLIYKMQNTLVFGARIRVIGDMTARTNLNDVAGWDRLMAKGNHSSMMVGVPYATLPANPISAKKAFDAANGVDWLCNELAVLVEKAAPITVEKSALLSWMSEKFTDMIPDVPENFADLTSPETKLVTL